MIYVGVDLCVYPKPSLLNQFTDVGFRFTQPTRAKKARIMSFSSTFP